MDIKTFESEIDPVIASRGRAYYQDGRVSTLDEIAPGLYHATADGSARYEIDIRMKGSRVVSSACSCPYDRGKYCKHVVAALIQLRNQHASSNEEQTTQGDDTLPHDTYEAVLAYLKSRDSTTAASPAKQRAKRTRHNQRALSIDTATRMIEEGLEEFRTEWDDRWSDCKHGYSYKDNDVAMSGANQVADNIEHADDPAQACLLALAALAYVAEFVSNWDDSDGIAYETMTWLEMLLKQRCAELAKTGSEILKSQVINALVAASFNPIYEGWGSQVHFLRDAAELAENPRSARFIADAIVAYEESDAYSANELVPTHYHLLLKISETDARAYAEKNALHPYFFIARLEELFLQHDMDACRKLLEEKTGWSASPKSTDSGERVGERKPHDFSKSSLPSDVFPNGYFTFLEAILEEQRDRSGLLALYRNNLNNLGDHTSTLDRMKRVAGKDWIAERDKIIDSAISSRWPNYVAEDLIRADSLAEAALRYCQADVTHNQGMVTKGSERILRFYRLVGEAYPEEAREMLLDLVEAKANGVTSNDMYREICNVVQCYMSLFGANDARRITASLRERFARRRNLMKELDKLEESWV